MTVIYVDASDMSRWARYLEDLPRKTGPALARGLNSFGDLAKRSMALQLADETGLEAGAVMNLIVVREATAQRLEYEIDASAVMVANAEWTRPWAERDKSTFEQDTLVKIVTMGDKFDCEICEQVAENSPWTMREIAQNQGKWTQLYHGSHGNRADGLAPGVRTDLIHINCRCVYQPWTSTRRMPLSFGGAGAPPELLTARQLGERVAEELVIAIKVVKS